MAPISSVLEKTPWLTRNDLSGTPPPSGSSSRSSKSTTKAKPPPSASSSRTTAIPNRKQFHSAKQTQLSNYFSPAPGDRPSTSASASATAGSKGKGKARPARTENRDSPLVDRSTAEGRRGSSKPKETTVAALKRKEGPGREGKSASVLPSSKSERRSRSVSTSARLEEKEASIIDLDSDEDEGDEWKVQEAEPVQFEPSPALKKRRISSRHPSPGPSNRASSSSRQVLQPPLPPPAQPTSTRSKRGHLIQSSSTSPGSTPPPSSLRSPSPHDPSDAERPLKALLSPSMHPYITSSMAVLPNRLPQNPDAKKFVDSLYDGTGAKRLKKLSRPRFDWETDEQYAARKREEKELLQEVEERKNEKTMKPPKRSRKSLSASRSIGDIDAKEKEKGKGKERAAQQLDRAGPSSARGRFPSPPTAKSTKPAAKRQRLSDPRPPCPPTQSPPSSYVIEESLIIDSLPPSPQHSSEWSAFDTLHPSQPSNPFHHPPPRPPSPDPRIAHLSSSPSQPSIPSSQPQEDDTDWQLPIAESAAEWSAFDAAHPGHHPHRSLPNLDIEPPYPSAGSSKQDADEVEAEVDGGGTAEGSLTQPPLESVLSNPFRLMESQQYTATQSMFANHHSLPPPLASLAPLQDETDLRQHQQQRSSSQTIPASSARQPPIPSQQPFEPFPYSQSQEPPEPSRPSAFVKHTPSPPTGSRTKPRSSRTPRQNDGARSHDSVSPSPSPRRGAIDFESIGPSVPLTMELPSESTSEEAASSSPARGKGKGKGKERQRDGNDEERPESSRILVEETLAMDRSSDREQWDEEGESEEDEDVNEFVPETLAPFGDVGITRGLGLDKVHTERLGTVGEDSEREPSGQLQIPKSPVANRISPAKRFAPGSPFRSRFRSVRSPKKTPTKPSPGRSPLRPSPLKASVVSPVKPSPLKARFLAAAADEDEDEDEGDVWGKATEETSGRMKEDEEIPSSQTQSLLRVKMFQAPPAAPGPIPNKLPTAATASADRLASSAPAPLDRPEPSPVQRNASAGPCRQPPQTLPKSPVSNPSFSTTTTTKPKPKSKPKARSSIAWPDVSAWAGLADAPAVAADEEDYTQLDDNHADPDYEPSQFFARPLQPTLPPPPLSLGPSLSTGKRPLSTTSARLSQDNLFQYGFKKAGPPPKPLNTDPIPGDEPEDVQLSDEEQTKAGVSGRRGDLAGERRGSDVSGVSAEVEAGPSSSAASSSGRRLMPVPVAPPRSILARPMRGRAARREEVRFDDEEEARQTTAAEAASTDADASSSTSSSFKQPSPSLGAPLASQYSTGSARCRTSAPSISVQASAAGALPHPEPDDDPFPDMAIPDDEETVPFHYDSPPRHIPPPSYQARRPDSSLPLDNQQLHESLATIPSSQPIELSSPLKRSSAAPQSDAGSPPLPPPRARARSSSPLSELDEIFPIFDDDPDKTVVKPVASPSRSPFRSSRQRRRALPLSSSNSHVSSAQNDHHGLADDNDGEDPDDRLPSSQWNEETCVAPLSYAADELDFGSIPTGVGRLPSAGPFVRGDLSSVEFGSSPSSRLALSSPADEYEGLLEGMDVDV